MKYIIYRIHSKNEYDGHINYAAGRRPKGTEKLGEASTPEEAQQRVAELRLEDGD